MSRGKCPCSAFYELAAGKLTALLSRSAARDFFDAAGLFAHPCLDYDLMRLPFIVMAAAQRDTDIRDVKPETVAVAAVDFKRHLLPLLRKQGLSVDMLSLQDATRCGFSRLLPLRTNELCFWNALWEDGLICPEFLTSEPQLQEKIRLMPSLRWKAKNVRSFRKPGAAGG